MSGLTGQRRTLCVFWCDAPEPKRVGRETCVWGGDGLPRTLPITRFQPMTIDPEHLKELAAAGGICDRCGGVHLMGSDQVIHMIALKRERKVALPWCTCSPCPECGPWKDKAAVMIEQLESERREKQPR